MFWIWFFTIIYSAGACCAIANMSKGTSFSDKLFRLSIATLMLIMAIAYGTILILTYTMI